MGVPPILRDLDDRAPRRAPIGPLPPISVVLATFVVAGLVAWATTGGGKWELAALLGMLCCAAFAAWLHVERRFVDFAVWLMTFTAPVAIDVELYHRVGSNPLMEDWPLSYALNVRDLVMYLLYACWALDIMMQRGTRTWRLRWPAIWACVFLAAGVISFAQSPDPLSSFISWARTAHYVLMFVYLAKRVDDRVLLKWLLVAIAFHVWLEALISSLQYATGSSLGLEFLGERSELKTFDTPVGADPRAGGLMGHPNDLALYFVVMGPIILSQLLKPQKGAVRWLLWASTYAALNFGLLLTFSRAGWLCAGATALIVFHSFMQRAGRPKVVSLGLPIGLGVFSFVMLFALWTPFRERLLEPDLGSTMTRWQQFRTAFNVIRHRWLTGTGLGAYCQGAWQFNAGAGTLKNVLYRVHNGSLLVTAELGILGGVAYHAWFWLVMRRGWKLLKLADPELWAVAVGCFTGLLGWFAKSMYNVHTPITDISLWYVAALVFVVSNCAARAAREQEAQRESEAAAATAPSG